MAQRQWTRDELILAFNLYCKLPFGRIHYRNPEIIALAILIGRTPASVSWKLANFARLDPEIRARKLSGATHGAKGEEDVWREFSGNWSELAYESERLLAQLQHRELVASSEHDLQREGKTREALVRIRVNQAFFRASVLAAYDSKCCITGLPTAELLNASHIVPWSADIANRVNPRNGLCLNALHDRAFDCGLLTITLDYRVKVCEKVRNESDATARSWLKRYDGKPIRLPKRFTPQKEFLEYHNKRVFRGAI